MSNNKTKRHLAQAAIGIGLAALISGGSTAAMAAPNTGTTEVTVRASNENLKFRVPTIIPFSAAADGKLTGPSAQATQIENLSVFGIHVINMAVKQETPWTLVADAAKSQKENSIDFQVGPSGKLEDAYGASKGSGIDLSAKSDWNLTYAGSEGDGIPLSTTGDIAKSTGDIYHAADKVATITWTLEAGQSGA